MRYRALDRVDNTEPDHQLELRSDGTAPMTALEASGTYYTATGPDGARSYAPAYFTYALPAQDPMVQGVASGLAKTSYRIDSGQAQDYASAFSLTEGIRRIDFWSEDRVQNAESAKSATVYVDATAPQSSLEIGAPQALSGGLSVVSGKTPLIVRSTDPVSSDAASGVQAILFRRDLEAFAVQSGTFGLTGADGIKAVAFYAKDNVGNAETEKSRQIGLDNTAPVTDLLVLSGKQFQDGASSRFYASTATAYRLSAQDPLVNEVAAGIEFSEYSLDGAGAPGSGAPHARFAQDILLQEGVRSLAYRSQDRVENLETSRSTMVYVDGTAPLTEAVLTGPRYGLQPGDSQPGGTQAVGGPLFIASHTLFGLRAQDPAIADGIPGSGVGRTLYGLDSGISVPFSTDFPILDEGPHLIGYHSLDNVSNEESLKSFALSVDSTPPVTEISFQGYAYRPIPGSGSSPPEADVFIASPTLVVLTARDLVSAQTASGVLITRYRIDGGSWIAYSGPFLPAGQGLHVVEWRSWDRVLNEEQNHLLRVAVDQTPPSTTLSLGEPKTKVFGLDIITPQTPITLSAQDPVADGVAVGVSRISYRIDFGPLLDYTSSFVLPQGTHIIEFGSLDRLENAEGRKTLTLAVSDFQLGAVAGVDGITGSGTADIKGLVQSNATVGLSGTVRVAGDVKAATVTLTGQKVTGTITRGIRPLLPEPISLDVLVPLAQASSSNHLIPAEFLVNGVITISGGRTLVLGTGTYVVQGLQISGGGTLAANGPVSLLVQGEARINGGGKLNSQGRASDLALFSNSQTLVHFSGGAQAVGLFYAPRAALEVFGNARIGGHLFAKTARVSGTSNIMESGEILPLDPSSGSGGGKKVASASAANTPVDPSAASADPSFTLRDVYVFPNPAVAGAKPVIHVAVGIADSLTIRIYNIAGQQVHETTLDRTPAIIDDGSGPKYAYEYAWEGHIPSGVYLYSIEAKKNGYSSIRKAGRFGVVR